MEREVLFERAARIAAESAPPPFHLRPGLTAALLDFYDELRRRGRTVARFSSALADELAGAHDLDEVLAVGNGRVDLSAVDGVFFEVRATDSGRDEVLPAGRFLLSGMRLKIIPSLAGCDQLDQSTLFTVALRRTHGLARRNEDTKKRRGMLPRADGFRRKVEESKRSKQNIKDSIKNS